jgi:hypothetical protein
VNGHKLRGTTTATGGSPGLVSTAMMDVMANHRLDVISFSVGHEDFPGHEGEPVVVVRVNGTDLRELVHAEDEAFVPVYAGKSLDYWLGRTASRAWTYLGRTAVLTCGCMDFGCGETGARISSSSEEVIWSDIPHPFAPGSSIGPFHFDRQEYERAVHTLLREVDDLA